MNKELVGSGPDTPSKDLGVRQERKAPVKSFSRAPEYTLRNLLE
jgi:hypothetical protein